MVLILLLGAHFGKMQALMLPAIVVLALTMTWPALFTPLARIWFGFSHLLGGVVSKILLSIVYLMFATPIGLLRRFLGGADAMRLKAWKDGRPSAFVERDHLFSGKDLETPY